MAKPSVGAQSVRDNQSTKIDRSQLPKPQSDLIFDLVMDMEEIARQVESLSCLIWMVGRFEGWSPTERDALDGVYQLADTISQKTSDYSDRFGVSFGFNSGAEPSPARGLQDRASAAFAN